MKSSPELLIKQLRSYFPGGRIESAYEAGFCGYYLHRQLKKAGIKNIVINPGSVEVSSREKVKTDKIDAKKIAEQLAAGRLRCVYIPDEAQELARVLSRTRARLIKDRARTTNRIKSLLCQFGYWGADDEDKACQKWVKGLQYRTDLPSEISYSLDLLCEDWLRFSEKIQRVDKQLKRQTKASKKLEALELMYCSFPGVGEVSARELSRELADFKTFSSGKKVASYTGLTPSEHSSGQHRRQGGISHCGKPRLRHLLTEISWRAVANDPELGQKFEKLAYRRGKKRAIIAIARILIIRMYSCVSNGLMYQPHHLKTC